MKPSRRVTGRFLAACAVAPQLILPVPLAASELDVDLALVLAVDVSSSMNQAEQQAQRDGYVNAFRNPEVRAAIASGTRGKILVAYLEWAGSDYQRVLIPWRVVNGFDASSFADELEALPVRAGHGTSISGGLMSAAMLLASPDVSADRWVIDVSGDGPNNAGPALESVRDALVAEGVVINGLAISLLHGLEDTADNLGPGFIEVYYNDCVAGGPGAFVIGVDSAAQFADAIRRKLVLEIAGIPTRPLPISYRLVSGQRVDCSTVGQLPGR